MVIIYIKCAEEGWDICLFLTILIFFETHCPSVSLEYPIAGVTKSVEGKYKGENKLSKTIKNKI